MTDMKMGDLEQ